MTSAPHSVLDLTLPSTFDALEEAMDKLQAFLEQAQTDDDLTFRITLLASEALTNAMEHGNQWNPEKSATLRVAIDPVQVRLDVTDQGRGLSRPDHDPLDEENLLHDHGRGWLLMNQMADEVCFEIGGNQLTLVFKQRNP